MGAVVKTHRTPLSRRFIRFYCFTVPVINHGLCMTPVDLISWPVSKISSISWSKPRVKTLVGKIEPRGGSRIKRRPWNNKRRPTDAIYDFTPAGDDVFRRITTFRVFVTDHFDYWSNDFVPGGGSPGRHTVVRGRIVGRPAQGWTVGKSDESAGPGNQAGAAAAHRRRDTRARQRQTEKRQSQHEWVYLDFFFPSRWMMFVYGSNETAFRV